MSIGELKKQYEILVPDTIEHLPKILKSDNDIVFDRSLLCVCRKESYDTEKYIAERIKTALKNSTKWECDYTKFRSVDGFDLTEEQAKVSEYMCKNNIVMLVGNAGSGKSSSTSAFVEMLKYYKKDYSIFAPTGRAAKVIANFTGENAMTIHRGLGHIPPNMWTYNEENILTKDVVIVDEFSMCDI